MSEPTDDLIVIGEACRQGCCLVFIDPSIYREVTLDESHAGPMFREKSMEHFTWAEYIWTPGTPFIEPPTTRSS